MRRSRLPVSSFIARLAAPIVASSVVSCAGVGMHAANAAEAPAPWPSRPIRLIVSTAPGGGADVTARLVAPRLADALGQSVLVENRAGASGMIAGELVAKSPPDGHVVLLDITTHAVNPALFAKLPYEPLRDLVPVTQIIRAPNVLVVHPSVPVSTVAEFVRHAKESGGSLAVASSGNGSAQHLAAELFKQRAGIDMIHLPYKGGGPALADVVAGQVPVFFAFLASAAPHMAAGRLKPIAVTSSTRALSHPQLPTIAESGYPGYEMEDFNGLYVPAGTPPAVIDRLQQAVGKVLASADVRERLAAIGAEPVGSTPAQFAAFLRREMAKFAAIVKAANVKVD